MLALLAVGAVACAAHPLEQHLLRSYFDLCAAADDVALANAALVVLDPRADGVVGHFRVTGAEPPVRQPASASPHAAELSLFDPHGAHDVSSAVLVTKQVHVSAEIHRDGLTRRQPLTITLARAETRETTGRWIVVRLVPGGRTLRAVSSVRRSGSER